MKHNFYIVSTRFFVLFSLFLWGCTSSEPVLPDEEQDRGEAVTLVFDMYGATLTRADAEGTTSTTDKMAIGTKFRIYAFKAGDLAAPLDNRIYEIQPDESDPTQPGKATGKLTLYRGNYDLYLVSYNSSNDIPELKDGAFMVGNGKDFMYTKLENIVVQPNQTGENQMLVSLPRPFTRMGAQIVTSVKARNSYQPVTPNKMLVNYIKVTNLHSQLTYKLNSISWEKSTEATDGSYTFLSDDFENNTLEYEVTGENRKSDPGVLLPVDDSQKLKFEVNLTVYYTDNSIIKISTSSYYATIEKSLLPGMTYRFDFSLTFYGAIVPSDLTLGIREWTTTELTGENMGKD